MNWILGSEETGRVDEESMVNVLRLFAFEREGDIGMEAKLR
jgi:hypothetical protein